MARYWIFAFACVVTGCSGDDDPPVLNPRVNGEAGDGSGGSTSGRGGSETGGSGNSGTGGSGNTGGLARPDPDEIYILGTLDPNRQHLGVICHWSTPDDYAAGMPEIDVYRATLTDEGMYYRTVTNRAEVRLFVPDIVTSEPLAESDYPTATAIDNDPVVAELRCPQSSVPFYHVVGPGNRVVYLCTSPDRWYEHGAFIYEGPGDMLSLGENDFAFFSGSGVAPYVANLATLERYPVEGIGTVYDVRAGDEGFLVAGIGDEGEGLWEVAEDGTARSLGLYSESDGFGVYSRDLDAEGNLWEIQTHDARAMLSGLYRRTIDGGHELMYSDNEPGNVFIGQRAVVTGP